MADLSEQKTVLRAAMIGRRDALSADVLAAAAEALAGHAPHLDATNKAVSAFWPMRSEIDARPLMRSLAARGAKLALPVVVRRGEPLTFRAFTFGDALVVAPFGLREPAADKPDVLPDLLLVPLLAFDRRGHRLGYGAGFYDRTLATLRDKKPIRAIGLAFAAQEIEAVPAGPHDAPLDAVLTEHGLIDCRESP